MKKIKLPNGDEIWDFHEVAMFIGVHYNSVLSYKDREEDPLPVIYISSKEQGVLKSSLIDWILRQEKNGNNKVQKESANAKVSRGI